MNWRPTLCLAVLASVLMAVLLPALSQASAPSSSGEIAFSTPVNGVAQLFTVMPNGTQLRQITHGASDAGNNGLSWSPDGHDLLYVVVPNDVGEIIRSRADGSGVTVISPPCTGTCLGDGDPVYSPDGKKIAFVRALGPIVNGNASVIAIFTMNADGTKLTQLTQTSTPTSAEDHNPQWSPNGKEIAFVRLNDTATPQNETAIEVMNADGSNVRRLTPWRIGAGPPHWSPNGRRLLFNTYQLPTPSKSANLFTMRADGTHRVALTHYAGGTLQAFADDWSPNGKRIVFHRVAFSGTDTQVGHFYIFDSRSKHIRRLTPVRITGDARAAWGK